MFYGEIMCYVFNVIICYWKEMVWLVVEMMLGVGVLVMIGGMVGVVVFLILVFGGVIVV